MLRIDGSMYSAMIIIMILFLCVYLPFLFKFMIFWRISFHSIARCILFDKLLRSNEFIYFNTSRTRASQQLTHTFKFEYGCCAICLAVNLANYDVRMVKLDFEINTFSMLTLIAFFFFNSIVWLILDFFFHHMTNATLFRSKRNFEKLRFWLIYWRALSYLLTVIENELGRYTLQYTTIS